MCISSREPLPGRTDSPVAIWRVGETAAPERAQASLADRGSSATRLTV